MFPLPTPFPLLFMELPMKSITVDVKSSRKNKKNPAGQWCAPDGTILKSKGTTVKVGEVTYDEYDSLSEMVSKIGEPKVLSLANTQLATNAKNTSRAEAVGGVSMETVRMTAMKRIMESPDKLAAFQTAGDDARRAALMEAEIESVKSELGVGQEDEGEE